MELKDILKQAAGLTVEGNINQAVALLKSGLREHPGNSELVYALAKCHEKSKQFGAAQALYANLKKDDGTMPGKVAVGLANSLLGQNRFADALKVYTPVLKAQPDHIEALLGVARCAEGQGRLDDAKKLLKKIPQQHHNAVPVIYQRGRVLVAEKQYDQAVELLEKNTDRPDPHGDSIDLWIEALKASKRELYLREKLEQYVEKYPQRPEYVFGLGLTCARAGDIGNGRDYLTRALELLPNHYRVYYELAVLERQSGNIDESRALLEKVLELKPDHTAALRTYGNDHKYQYGDSVFVNLNREAAKITTMSDVEQMQLHYALGKAFDDVGELDTAFSHYAVGGAKKRKQDPYKEQTSGRMFGLMQKIVNKEWIDLTNQPGCESETPVFILGMPRSGTSLMEQILSSHPDIYGAGELKLMTSAIENVSVNQRRIKLGDVEGAFDYDLDATFAQRGQWYADTINGLTDKPYKRVVDKMPGNFNFVGLIHAFLPKARIIHSRRHPVETCLSCYRILFAEGHQWTYDLGTLGRYYRRYWDLMEHWRSEFPGAMYEVRYEDNVADVEGQARALIDHLGLDWNDGCLDFYNTDRPVKTASASQVRKPIYTTSTNRWRKYEKFLKPLLDEIGDIVESYEAEIAHLIEK